MLLWWPSHTTPPQLRWLALPQGKCQGQGASPGPVFFNSKGWGHSDLLASSESDDPVKVQSAQVPPTHGGYTQLLAWHKLQAPFPGWCVLLYLWLCSATSLRISVLFKVGRGISKYSELLIAQSAPDGPLKAGMSASK